ncbi:MAG TPA: AmmeMemoRadiSam system radical SAM enzyme [Aggregatilinea sp.]|uniref:AmmeMemoRadiSam system radical SAM enzyme n=1 Tax=Aggregatilinea sp. TaxID=2806333 RepID=UPI002CCBABDE|nr:AmmeMemoRadiSam system radical SAM enzyme [Aggregatilinea sp.]HML22717.1 AmmeMemoRadiSam system radical SAM enzyme [Aggregatilinea sp.]
MTSMVTLQDQLDRMTAPGDLVQVVDAAEHKIRCVACGHRCLLKDGRRGICKVRYNDGGVLRVPQGYVGALQIDPIEKKPFFHVTPGAQALSFGMLGCDFRCSYCQNWEISQTLRDEAAGRDYIPISARELVALGRSRGARAVASTYNEPLITSEWAVEVFKQAREAGLMTLYISNGNGTPEVIEYLTPWLDGYKIDLKTMNDKHYRRELGGVLQHVLDTIKRVHEAGIWLEVLTLVIPGFNDSSDELWDAARYIRGVSPDIPWHVTAFHPDYKMIDPPPTSVDALRRASEIGAEAGLNYVYAGNLPGRVDPWEDTVCPSCHTPLIRRYGYLIRENKLATTGGVCPQCGTTIPGIWH